MSLTTDERARIRAGKCGAIVAAAGGASRLNREPAPRTELPGPGSRRGKALVPGLEPARGHATRDVAGSIRESAPTAEGSARSLQEDEVASSQGAPESSGAAANGAHADSVKVGQPAEAIR